MKSKARELSIYAGRDCVGMLIVRNGRVDAFDAQGRRLGTFENIEAATEAITGKYAEAGNG
jgi:hypothetical protein